MTPLLLLRALEFAARKHRDQRRKDEEASPYINHPISVALLLAEIGGVTDTDILAAAILHDTLEDTDTKPEELEAAFGLRIRKLVEEVTDDKTLPKDARKRRQIEHAEHLSADAILIKLGDKIANVVDVTRSRHRAGKSNGVENISNGRKQWSTIAREVNAALEQHFAQALEEGLAQTALRQI